MFYGAIYSLFSAVLVTVPIACSDAHRKGNESESPKAASGVRVTHPDAVIEPKASYNVFGFGYTIVGHGDILAVGGVAGERGIGDTAPIFVYELGSRVNMVAAVTPHMQARLGFWVTALGEAGLAVTMPGLPIQVYGPSDANLRYEYSSNIHPLTVFGAAIAWDANSLLVGAPGSGSSEESPGAVYEVDHVTDQVTLLAAPKSLAVHSRFGISLCSDGRYLVVGSPGSLERGLKEAGRVFVYDRASNALLYSITSPSPLSGGEFGCAIATDGNRLIVGEPRRNTDRIREGGRAYMYDLRDGTLEAEIRACDEMPGDCFGISVDADDGTIVVGAPMAYHEGRRTGAAYVNDVDGGHIAKLVAGHAGEYSGSMGVEVRIVSGWVCVGEPSGGTKPEKERGVVWLYRLSKLKGLVEEASGTCSD